MESAEKQLIQPVRAVTVLSLLTIVAILISVVLLLWDLRTKELNRAVLAAESIARMLDEQTSQAINGVDLILDGIQERLQTNYGEQLALDTPTVHLLLAARVSSAEQVRTLFLVDRDGTVVNSSRVGAIAVGASVRDRPYFQALANGPYHGLFVGSPVLSRHDNTWRMHLARQLTDHDGRFRGIAVVSLSLPYFEKLYNLSKLDLDRPISLYMDDGTLIASNPHRETEIGKKAPEFVNRREISRDQELLLYGYSADNGKSTAYVLGKINRFPLWLSVRHDEDEALAVWRNTAMPIAAGAIVVCLFIGLVAMALATELRRKEQLSLALIDADHRYRLTVDSVRDAIVGVDEKNHIVLFNPEAERMFGYKAEEMLGHSLDQLIPESSRAQQHLLEDHSADEGAWQTPGPGRLVTGMRADRSEFLIESSISQTAIGNKRQFTAVLRDVTERQRQEDELREMNRQLRNLSATLEDVRERERRRIAHELHDELGQQLTGLKLELSWLGNRMREGHSGGVNDIVAMGRMLDHALASVRRISSELRPQILDDLGFGEAVRWLAQETTRRIRLDIHVDLPAAHLVVDDQQAIGLYRIVQESLTNIARHARASEVSISLTTDDTDMLRLTISDNGQGFQDGQGSNIGLAGMRERARAIGGECRVTASPGAGVTVEVLLPLEIPEIEKETS